MNDYVPFIEALGGLNHTDDNQNGSDVDPAVETVWADPMPLSRPLAKPEPYPIDALGVVLGNAAQGIADIVLCPLAIAGCSVLAVASLAAQAHADVKHPATGRSVPLSLYVLTIAETGERKSAADAEALDPLRKREADLGEDYKIAFMQWLNEKEAWDAARSRIKRKAGGERPDIQAALDAVGDPPTAPLSPILVVSEPTYEGLVKHFAVSHPSLGLFSAEGGGFIGGHAMGKDTRLRALTGLSELWDGSPMKRVRAGEITLNLPGRRLALHLMAQPNVTPMLLADDLANGQGFLSRLLVCAPVSTQGRRFQREQAEWARPAIDMYASVIMELLETLPNTNGDNALIPRALVLSPAATAAWKAFADQIECQLGAAGGVGSVRGLMNKIPEMALRISGILAMIDDAHVTEISQEVFQRGCALAEYHLGEAKRLYDVAVTSPEISMAQKLLSWLLSREGDEITLRDIQTLGPNQLRERQAIDEALATLEGHNWIKQVTKNTGGRPSEVCVLSPLARRE